MRCDHILSELPAYLEGLLEPSEAAEVAEHLSACPSCMQEARSQEAVWELLGADEPVEVPADLARRVIDQGRPDDSPEPARVVRFPLWRRWAAPAFAAAAAVLIVIGAFYLQRASKEGPVQAGISEEEQQVLAHLDFLEEYDLLMNLDMLENLELLKHQEIVQNL